MSADPASSGTDIASSRTGPSSKDTLFAAPLSRIADFEFDDDVVRVFPDMISRSVPGYSSILAVIEQLAGRCVQPDTHVWDLGCSLGAATRLIRRRSPPSATVHAVDSSDAMINRLQSLIRDTWEPGCPVEVHLADIRSLQIHSASFVVLNLTLQFIPPSDREQLLTDIASGMLPGGTLLLAEKLCFDDPASQLLLTDLHHDFKRAHGYTELEIAQKRTSIENRLIPETLDTHIQRLRRAGFRSVVPWFQCFNFASVLAIR
ncbi:MAG: carboxy-S-adenosyl-L-methionine synthase CmoA [Planctomycetaceae bacterium]